MAFLTDRKRAVGMGAAHSGAHHMWGMTVSSVALLILVPLFVFTFGPMLGKPYEEVIAYFEHPFPAIVAALTIVVGFVHFKNGVQSPIEDYTDGLTRKILIIAMTCLSYAAAATGVFAIARIAL
ncbi:MAG: succinate dehydrogenase, hydrophobic membrane anchor protein [Confluentimicrobium sp.]|jgi:succinate dehydrogenase / fumarate reductase membrane anchor subunit|uniref:Succinate dehydrogenase hydrophobic membrane anchor subunit n=1 Tax=Actibacterium naphthalenivorans TaxID=1614693 RepID=A0A840CG62_9RHOB|nr:MULTISPECIES: succinate dehydrogenase, hydrophobic membrane anchor protein [Actibacterium]KGB81210.1 succinate dehydrogenase [Rhodovulum sp. NI22]MDY6858579.1 succinate dehydrogenase, hydrophobic membrane anchor protein [Pseudomonadota bacterium]ALG89240.1 succinate dehydrogenase [Actibacterium sp. EMB200-NS6]MBB4021167.1 succinate dehydrogenase / fumarate reductase membrane anchor subunit [Actibacterium naphthalenivorans]MBC56264.1 succinate dehydrogenase, hydrophobic membrane anchor prote|tara:strand:+ start:827 stop:1198 length:372 start_codon:yes stop_codon:yes gene_type:complete